MNGVPLISAKPVFRAELHRLDTELRQGLARELLASIYHDASQADHRKHHLCQQRKVAAGAQLTLSRNRR